MTADEAISKLPPGYYLEPLGLVHDYGPNGPTRAQILNDQYFGLAHQQLESIPLFFSQARRLVEAGPTFDEEKYVMLYEQRARKNQSER
jgi:hypothetical protein